MPSVAPWPAMSTTIERDLAVAGREEVVAVAGDDAFGRAETTGDRPSVGQVAHVGSSSDRSVSTTAALCSTA